MHVQLFLFIPCVFSQLQLAWISQILQLYLCRVPLLPWQAQGILSWAVLGLDWAGMVASIGGGLILRAVSIVFQSTYLISGL